LLHVMAEKSTPSQGRWFVLTGHLLGDGCLGHIDSDHGINQDIYFAFPTDRYHTLDRLRTQLLPIAQAKM
jgi:hypothetical protein